MAEIDLGFIQENLGHISNRILKISADLHEKGMFDTSMKLKTRRAYHKISCDLRNASDMLKVAKVTIDEEIEKEK